MLGEADPLMLLIHLMLVIPLSQVEEPSPSSLLYASPSTVASLPHAAHGSWEDDLLHSAKKAIHPRSVKLDLSP